MRSAADRSSRRIETALTTCTARSSSLVRATSRTTTPAFYGYADPITGLDATKGIPSYEQDPNKRVVVTYSSINGNGYGGYGEVVMGTKGTLVLEREKDVMLYKGSDTSSRIAVTDDKGGPTMDSYETGGPAAAVAKAADTGPVSRGYTEEMEHWAWCIRNR